MSTPMLSEKSESSSKSSSRSSRRERKMWNKPIKISKLPSFGFSGGGGGGGSDFATDQIPIIFSGYTAESEDSSSSEFSDDSRTHSLSSDDHEQDIDQGRSESMRRRTNLKSVSSMKVLKRQSTRGHRLKKMRSMKRITSSSRNVIRKKKKMNLDGLGLLEPHYLRPTSSSASKNVENIQKNLGVVRLKRIASLRYNGLLKATCSSAMKGSSSSSSKKSNDVCNYRYCSLHGRIHSHAADNGVTVPSLKRFVSMRRKFLKRQKSVNRRLVLLKRSLSRKGGSLGGRIATDQESNQEGSSSENCGNDSEGNEKSSDIVMVEADDIEDRGMESKPEIMDDSDGRIEKDLEENAAQCYGLCEQNVTVLEQDDGMAEGTKSEEAVGDDKEVGREGSYGEIQEEDKEEIENVSNDKEPKPDSMVLDCDNGIVEGTKSEEEDGKSTEDAWNETVALVKQAFDEILAEITEDDGADSCDSTTSSDMKPVKERDTYLCVIVSTSHRGEEEAAHSRGPKKWSYLKRVILLKRFLKSLDRREKRHGEESETMRLRRELIGERKNAEEWMLDHALRQVISTLDPSQKKKVKHLVKAFESLIRVDSGSRSIGDLESPERETLNSLTILRDNDNDLQEVIPRKDLEVDASSSQHLAVKEELDGLASSLSPGREENETLNSPTIFRDDKDRTDLQEVTPRKDLEVTSEASSSSLSISMKSLESKEDESSSQHLPVEEELDGLAFGKEEKTGDSEKQSLSTWRNLIQKHMVMSDNSEKNRDETDPGTGIEEEGGDAEAVTSIQKAFEMILSEIPEPTFDDEEIVSDASKSVKEEKEESKKSWNSLRKVILLKRFVKSLDNVRVFNPKKPWNLSGLEAENVLLRHRSTMERGKNGEELMLDYAMRQAISRLDPIQRKKVELLVQAFDTVLDGHETLKKAKNIDENGGEDKKDKQRRFQVHQKDLKGEEEEVDSKAKEPSKLLPPPPIRNAKQRIVVEKEKDSRMWKLIYKHMVTEKEETDSTIRESVDSVDDGGLEIDARKSNTVTLVREALEKILSEIPDNSSDEQSVYSDITTDQELIEKVSEEPKTNEKKVKGWNNVKKVILLKRFVSDLGRLSPKTPRFLPLEPDQEPEKIHLRHQTIGEKKNSEEWMLDYALRQAISTLHPSQRKKVSLLAQAFDTISLQDIGSTPGSTTSSRNISRQSSMSSMTVHSENDGNAEILRGRLINLQENLAKHDCVGDDMEEKQQCSSLWRFLCKQIEDNDRNQTSPQEEEESKEDTISLDGEKYETEAVELLGEVIDGISLEENQEQNITRSVSKTNNRWSNLKRVIQLRRFVKTLENVSRFNQRKRRFMPSNVNVEAERVNLRHQEAQQKRNNDEWMVDNALQEVVSKLTPARKVKVQLLVQAFESLSASGN